jgi:hypothetical protein
MQQEVSVADAREFSASQLKRSVILAKGHNRLKVDPDGSISHLHSLRARRAVFGREDMVLFKVQAGILVSQRPRDVRIRLTPGRFELISSEAHQLSHSTRLLGDGSAGYVRSVRIANKSDSPARLRMVVLHDPTSMSFRRERDPPGEIGVNAFNRGDHVVMDDVGDTTGVRVIGFFPRPSTVYMTKDRQRAIELLNSGELPDSVAGMSGAILLLTQWEFDLPQGGRTDLRITALYHPSSLETALSELGAVSTQPVVEREDAGSGAVFRCSTPSINFSYGWARAALESIEGEEDSLERLSCGFGLRLTRPDWYEKRFEADRVTMRRNGLLPHSSSEGDGVLETSLFVANACGFLRAKGDKKLAKKWYPSLRKAGKGLEALAKEGLIKTGADRPHGWRRRLGSGYPTGTLSEVNLAAAKALVELAETAYMAGKGSDSGSFRESSVKIQTAVNTLLREAESGNLALNIDPQGRLHKELTADQMVSLSRNPVDHNLASSMVHRMLDPDFESGFGPRTVPSSNALYYSPTYGDGQLGGYWTRVALAHATLAYASGYPSIGAMQLEKVARLVYSDCERLGGVPGEFPYWVDPDKKVITSVGSDPVAASNFIQALLVGEAGLDLAKKTRLNPPLASKVRWLILRDLDLGGKGSLFVGRSAKQVFGVSSYANLEWEGSKFLANCEQLEIQQPAEGLVFWDQSSVLVCLGNTSASDVNASVSASLKGKPVSRALYVDLEEYNQETSNWHKVERKRLLERLEFKTDLKAASWKCFRAVQITS